MSKRIIITTIAIGTAALHFFTGEQYGAPFPLFVNGYLIDILLPMTLVLLMGLFQNKILRSSLFRASVVFTIGIGLDLVIFPKFLKSRIEEK